MNALEKRHAHGVKQVVAVHKSLVDEIRNSYKRSYIAYIRGREGFTVYIGPNGDYFALAVPVQRALRYAGIHCTVRVREYLEPQTRRCIGAYRVSFTFTDPL